MSNVATRLYLGIERLPWTAKASTYPAHIFNSLEALLLPGMRLSHCLYYLKAELRGIIVGLTRPTRDEALLHFVVLRKAVNDMLKSSTLSHAVNSLYQDGV